MSLKIVLADDSMTAQNMGKKILVDAGFEVVTVSNGAAAVKKIAEVKPEIVILDIYMPGYTGLEVCEKIKAVPETANTPVLLTVGKLEPYRPEDGAKAQAEGVIIKPFEATDLLTALGKIAQKYNLKVPQIEPIEIKPREHVELPHDETYHAWKTDPNHEDTVRLEHGTQPAQPTVPDTSHAATVPIQTVPPAQKSEPQYEKTMRLSAKDLQAMLAKAPTEGAKTGGAAATVMPAVPPAPKAPEPAHEDERISTQKLEVPAFVKDEEEAPAAKPAAMPVEVETTSTPMFAIDEPTSELGTGGYTMPDQAATPAYMMDEPAVEAPKPAESSKFMASSVPEEVPTTSMDVSGVHFDTANAAPETMTYPSMSSADAVSLEYTENKAAAAAASAAPSASIAPVTPSVPTPPPPAHYELETHAPVSTPEVHHRDPELETTAHGHVEHSGETLMELETTGHQHEAVDVDHVIDPALVTSNDDLMQFAVKFTEPTAEEVAAAEAAQRNMAEETGMPVGDAGNETAEIAAVPEVETPKRKTEEIPVQELLAAARAQEPPQPPHSYEDDPLVQMGVVAVEPGAEATPELVAEFDKPVTEEEAPASAAATSEPEPPAVLEPASGVIRAMQQFESNIPTDEQPVEAIVEAAQATMPEVPPVAAPVPEPVHDDESMKKFATELHEAIVLMPNTPHTEPIHEEAAVQEVAAAPVVEAPKNLTEEMAAANSAFSDKLPAPPEPPREAVDSGHDHDLANSLAEALETAAKEKSSTGTGKTVQVSLDALNVARAVQKVFDRYKEQMIADIADELGKEQ